MSKFSQDLRNVRSIDLRNQMAVVTQETILFNDTIRNNIALGRPGATRVIFLDFDGNMTTGTLWNSNFNGGNAVVTPPYDTDGNPSSFSDRARLPRTARRSPK